MQKRRTVICAGWLLAAASLAAQVPGKPAPAPAKSAASAPPQAAPGKQPLVRPVFENDRVRVIEALWEPGAATSATKISGQDTLGVAAVVLKGGTVEHDYAKGKKVRRERRPGDVFWQPGNTQVEARQNAGNTRLDIIQVRLKKAPPTKQYTGPVAGEKKLLDNPRLAAFDITLAPGAKIPMHKYGPRVWVVLEGGDLRSWDKAEKSQVARVGAAQVLWLPAQEHGLKNIGKSNEHIISLELK